MFERIKLSLSLMAAAFAVPLMSTKIDPAIRVDSGTASRGAPRHMGQNHDAYSKEGFCKNAVAKRCIEMISQGVASIPIELFNSKTGEEIEDEEHPFLNLINNPNPFQSKEEFFEELISFFYIDGNTFFNTVKGGADKKGLPAELYVKNPKYMRLKIDEAGLPALWTYTNGQDTWEGHIDYVSKKSDVFHFKTFNPNDHWVGMSPLRSVADSVDQNNEAGEWNMWMLQNAGLPSGGFHYEPGGTPGIMPQDVYNRLKEEVKKNIMGPRNARAPMVTDGGIVWKTYGQNAVDMDWLEGTRASARQIAFGLGTPSQLIGIPGDNTYSNLEQADLAFYEKTVIILFNKLLKAINTYFKDVFGKNLELRGDLDCIPALEPRRKEKWEKVKDCDFLTFNEKREAVGYDILDVPEADMLWIQAGLVPLEDAQDLVLGAGDNPDDKPSDGSGENTGMDGAEPDASGDGKKPKPEDDGGDKTYRPRRIKKFTRYRTRNKNASTSVA